MAKQIRLFVVLTNYDRFYDNELIEWWRKLATKRYYKLKEDGRLRKDLEIWTRDTR